MEFFYSNIYYSVRSKLPLSTFKKKKVHKFSFVPFKGFSPWTFKEDRVLIYSMNFLFNRTRIKIYLAKGNEDMKLCLEVNGETGLKSYSFNVPIIRRNYDVSIIMTKSIIQFTLQKGKTIESVQFNSDNNFFAGFIYGPNLGFRGNSIIKIEHK